MTGHQRWIGMLINIHICRYRWIYFPTISFWHTSCRLDVGYLHFTGKIPIRTNGTPINKNVLPIPSCREFSGAMSLHKIRVLGTEIYEHAAQSATKKIFGSHWHAVRQTCPREICHMLRGILSFWHAIRPDKDGSSHRQGPRTRGNDVQWMYANPVIQFQVGCVSGKFCIPRRANFANRPPFWILNFGCNLSLLSRGISIETDWGIRCLIMQYEINLRGLKLLSLTFWKYYGGLKFEG